jgi:hypothetical protein
LQQGFLWQLTSNLFKTAKRCSTALLKFRKQEFDGLALK